MTRRERWTMKTLLTLTLGALIGFAVFWLQPSHLAHNFSGPRHVLDVVLFVVLTGVVAHRAFMDVFGWVVASRIGAEPAYTPLPEGYRVAFITSFVPSVEPVEMLREALLAMLRADYAHDTWVLDEGGSDEVRLLCQEVGALYFSRNGERRYNLVAGPFTRKTKGGNHNAWYDTHGRDYDFVAQLDMDFLPEPTFLTRTLGHFQDERVAFVGTPQVYGNESDSFVAKAAAQQQYSFYGQILRGLSARGMCTMIGANHVVRVAALESIGWYAGHLTEDLLTGMRIHARGWRSVYVAEVLAVGEGPTTWHAYINQQTRWAFGCMDILRRHTRSLTRQMDWRRRLLYISLQQHYFSGVAAAAGLAVLICYFGLGLAPADLDPVDTIACYAPFFVLRFVLATWLQRFDLPGHRRGLLLPGRLVSIAVSPFYLLAAIGVFRERRLVFKVTPKGGMSLTAARRNPATLYRPHLVIGMIAACCIAAGEVLGRTSVPLMFWALVTAIGMFGFALMIWAQVDGVKAAQASPVHVPADGDSIELSAIERGVLGGAAVGGAAVSGSAVSDAALLAPFETD